MHRMILALVLLGAAAWIGEAQYHQPVFITGGAGYSSSTQFRTGLFVLDGVNNKVTSVFPAGVRNYYLMDTCMDADNRSIVFVASTVASTFYNVHSGVFRIDPISGVIRTIAAASYPNNGPMYYQYKIMVNQDGDYVIGACDYRYAPPQTHFNFHVLKIDASARLSTVFTSAMLNTGAGDYAYFQGVIGTDIDTGDYLINTDGHNASSLSPLGSHPWIRIDPHVAGRWSTFSGGPRQYGKSIYHTTPNQDFATGNIEETYAGQLYAQAKGNHSYTTLWLFGRPGNWVFRENGVRDLQSAPVKRWYVPGYILKHPGSPHNLIYTPGYAILRAIPPFYTTVVDCDPNHTQTVQHGPTYYAYAWTLYGSRNIQTIKMGANRWQVRFSCPWHPRQSYLAVLGASGIRPGVALPSGRRIWINPDKLVVQSLKNRLRPFFDTGPGVLDAGGEAIASLDTRLLPPLNGLSVWIALVVLDPQAPDGIAFIPDTYVMKLP